MVRKQILITPEQNRRLKALAAAQGVAEADIVRTAIDQAIGVDAPADDWKIRLQRVCGTFTREEADRLKATVRQNRVGWGRRLAETKRRMRGED